MTSHFWSKLQPAQKRTVFYLSLAFLIPFLLVAVAFIVQGVHPFGERMILTVDLYHQYAPFVAELRQKIFSGESLFYSWNIGLGINFWAVFANYAASPLNILILLFPLKYLSDGIALITCIRAGLTGLFFALLLRDIDNRREDLFLCFFSSFYALCGWVLAYFWNIMWFDAVMLLPLIILGLRRLMRDRKPMLYCLSLFLCIWSNYYAGYFICLFLVLYLPVCFLTVFQRASLKAAWSSFWRFAVYSALAGGLTAALIYPTWLTLQNSSATNNTFPTDYALTQNLFDFLGRFFVTSYPNIRDGMANVYCGVVIFLFVPLYFLCTRIRLREKIGNGLILIFMYFSFSSRILDYIWHGFHFPNQIPYRQAFLMSFVLVIMAYKVIRNLKSFSTTEITITVAAVLAYLVLYEKFGEGKEEIYEIFLTAVFVIAYGMVFNMILRGSKSLHTQKTLFVGIMAAELTVACLVTIGLVSRDESFTGWDFYGKNSGEVSSFVDKEAESGAGGIFFRTEMYPAYISNEPTLYNVKGMSVFSSTADQRLVSFMRSLGFHNNGINGVRNFGMTKVTSTLLGVRYFIDLSDNSPMPSGFAEVSDTGDLKVVENEDALSVGYMVSSDALSYEPQNLNNPFKTTNTYLQSLGTNAVYEPEELTAGALVNASFSSGSAENGYFFNVSADDVKTEIHFVPNARTAGSHLYLYVQSDKPAVVSVTATDPDTSETVSTQQETRAGQIIDIGTYDPSSSPDVKLSWDSASAGTVTVLCYSINDQAYEQMTAALGKSQLTVTSYDSTHLNGTVNAESDGLLLLTIPFDSGWTAEVDGQDVPIQSVGNALMALSLTKGEHVISLAYIPEGFGKGLAISLASLTVLLLLAGIPFGREMHRRMKKGKELLAAREDETRRMPDDLSIHSAQADRVQTAVRRTDAPDEPEADKAPEISQYE